MFKSKLADFIKSNWVKAKSLFGRLRESARGKLSRAYTVAQEKVGGRNRLIAVSAAAGLCVLLIVVLVVQQGSREAVEAAPPGITLDEIREPMTVSIVADSLVGMQMPVTLVFSEPVDIESLRHNLTVRPNAAHTLSQIDEYSVRIRPITYWSGRQAYTHIIVGTGYVSQNGGSFTRRQELQFFVSRPGLDYIPEDDEQEEDDSADRPVVRFWGSGQSYVLDENVSMSLYFEARNLEERIPVAVETYRLHSIERSQQQGYIFLNYDAPLSLLERVDANVFLLENGDNFFSLPHGGEGAYIIAVSYIHPHTGEESRHRTSYLITPLSVYIQTTVRDTLVWINSSRTGNAVPGLRIHFGDAAEPHGITDHNGLAFFSRDIDDYASSFRIYNQNGEMIYFDNGVSQFAYGRRERFYSYLFLDRTIYRPEDVINFWGIAQPFRTNEHEMPDTVRITFDPGGLNLEQDVPIGPGGVFGGEIELERIRSAQYRIQASLHFSTDLVYNEESGAYEEVDTHVVFEVRHVSVRDFHKPAYTISSEVDRGFYGPNDTVTVTAHVAFFDGTPLPNSAVEVSFFNHVRRE